jgi:hypothetical protein
MFIILLVKTLGREGEEDTIQDGKNDHDWLQSDQGIQWSHIRTPELGGEVWSYPRRSARCHESSVTDVVRLGANSCWHCHIIPPINNMLFKLLRHEVRDYKP